MDCRIARRGYTADLDDINDRKKISFAATRPSFANVAEAGRLTGADTWLGMANSYANSTPIPIFSEVVDGKASVGRLVGYSNAATDTVWATSFVLVSDSDRLMATSPTKSRQPFPSAGVFNYMCVA